MCAVSLAVNPHFGYDLFGAPYIRLGSAGLAACAGFGLLCRSVSRARFAAGLYLLICLFALVSVPYSWFHMHSLWRIGGLFLQADIFAVFLGCGLLFGAHLMRQYTAYRSYIAVAQLALLCLLVVSGTRAVLILLALLYPAYVQLAYGLWRIKKWLLYVALVVLLAVTAAVLLPSRLTSPRYADQSIAYRFALQRAALHASTARPYFGYGAGNLADALDCRTLHDEQLLQTCRQSFFFNSSHDIFIDRVLAVGWIGGISYAAIVFTVIIRGWRRGRQIRPESAAALLIAGYYLTNVTSVPLEILFWALLLRSAADKSIDRAGNSSNSGKRSSRA